MKRIRALLCYIIGHSFICLHRKLWFQEGSGLSTSASTTTGWKCQRCGKLKSEQWDDSR